MPRTTASSPPPRSADLAIERLPWSVLGPEFIAVWGRPRGKNEPEHLEILGPTGSGKGVVLRDIVLERARRRGTHVVFIATKNADATTKSMGWPVVADYRGTQKYDQAVFWPRTSAIGARRKAYQNAKILDLLNRLWQPDANVLIVFDEWVYAESLSVELREVMLMYLREGRSHGITCVMGKQRPQGTARDMHSESDWKIAFPMSDLQDNERTAELFGTKRLWLPVIESLNRERFEFLIQHKLDKATYISWIDAPVRAAQRPDSYRR
jgi:hypothetical protein